MSKEFHYFNINALGEAVRYILHYTKQEFKDVRLDHATYRSQNIKSTLPYGQLPIYKEGDRVLTQSLAIAKYVARDADLIPTDPWKQAVLESIVYTIYDYWSNVRAVILEKDPVKKSELKKKVIEETIDYYFSRFEKTLKENGGFFAGKLSWAEFILCGLVESTNFFLEIEADKNYPTLKAVVEKIRNLPGVKEHIAARGPYTMPKF